LSKHIEQVLVKSPMRMFQSFEEVQDFHWRDAELGGM
jgi:hypothetical protein